MTKSQDYNLKSMREKFKSQGLFYTPPELAEWLKSLIPPNPRRVYDPTCGRGSLLSVFADDVAKYGQDIDADAIADATYNLTNFRGAVGDVLQSPAFIEERFDAIVANPPFSIRWQSTHDGYFAFAPTVPTDSRADYAFLIHILWMLDDDGTAAVINFPGIAYRGGREYTLRRWMIEQNVIDHVIHIPSNTFTDTAIATICIVFKKGRQRTDITFTDREHGITREVPFTEIVERDFTLSVQSYIQQEIEKPVVDTIALEADARAKAIKKVRDELRMSYLISQIEGWPFDDFVDAMRRAIDDTVQELRTQNPMGL
jgi:type I restriction-modification system DNA methylase subunit